MQEEMERAEKLKQLYEKALARANHLKDHKGRKKEAMREMDSKLGPQWRVEIQLPGVEVMDMGECGETAFFDRFQKALDDDGLSTFKAEQPEESLLKRVAKVKGKRK